MLYTPHTSEGYSNKIHKTPLPSWNPEESSKSQHAGQYM